MPSDPAAVPPRTSCCEHRSDCAQHNGPAEPEGPCDCGKGGPPCGGAPVPPPEWARKLADTCTGMTYDFIARLLASVREGAIVECHKAVVGLPWECDDYGVSVIPCDEAMDAILSLLHTPPSGGAG